MALAFLPALKLVQRYRLSVMMIVVASLFVTLFARLFYLQVVEGDAHAKAANRNQTRIVLEDAPRGRILDRDNNVLAGNREVDVITVERDALRRDAQLVERLAAFLRVDVSDIRRRIADPKRSVFKPVVVADHVDKAMVVALREHQSEFPGVNVSTKMERSYPLGGLGAHLIGYIGEMNEKELAARRSEGYQIGDAIGKVGIESAFEDQLRGKPGFDKIEVDANGRVVRVMEHRDPVPGNDVKLSLSLDLQRSAETALAEGLAVARTQVDITEGVAPNTKLAAPAGSVVALDPRDGTVLAMASYPSFDPGRFASGITTQEYAQLTDEAGSLPLTNRAIQGQYAPGSTFKLFTALAGLRTGVMSTGTPFVDNGTFTLGDRKYRNAQGKSYGTVDMKEALTVSSDVYFYHLGNELWNVRKRNGNVIQDVARDFGLGTSTGIELSGEQPGRIPDPENRKKQHEQNPKAFPEGNWYAGDNVNLAIGQGDTLATPLQLASAYGAFAIGGEVFAPHLATEIIDPNGTSLQRIEPKRTHNVSLTDADHRAITEGLRGVVARPSGTASSAFSGFRDGGFAVAGKTGTAQVTGKQDSALFVAYAPVDRPRLAVSVVLEQAGFGGAAAAPVARRVFEVAANQPQTEIRIAAGED